MCPHVGREWHWGVGQEPEVTGDLSKGSGHLGLTWLTFFRERAQNLQAGVTLVQTGLGACPHLTSHLPCPFVAVVWATCWGRLWRS